MKKQILSEEFRRMQKLAGIQLTEITEIPTYLKSKASVNEKITDYFKSKEQIIDNFFKALEKDKEKALKSIQPYYDEFTSDGPWHKAPEVLPNFYRLFPKEYFQPKSHDRGFVPGTPRKYESQDPYIPTPEDWKSDRTGTNTDSFINKKALNLTDKITKEEVENLLYSFEDFSLKKLGTDIASILSIGSKTYSPEGDEFKKIK